MRRKLEKDELDEIYDRKSKIKANTGKFDCEELVNKQPLCIEHGFEPSQNKSQSGESIKFDFRGIQAVRDFYVYAPEAQVEVQHFDSSVEGNGILVMVKKDWMDDNDVIVYWREPTQDQIAVQELTGVKHIETPASRKKREGDYCDE